MLWWRPWGQKVKVIIERRLRGQLNHHAEGAEDHTHQGHYTRVIKVAHDGQLLTKVLVLLEEDVLLVWPSEHLHCHWNVIICSPVNLQKEDFQLHSSSTDNASNTTTSYREN